MRRPREPGGPSRGRCASSGPRSEAPDAGSASHARAAARPRQETSGPARERRAGWSRRGRWRRPSRRRLTDDLEPVVTSKHKAQTFAHEMMVVNQSHPDRLSTPMPSSCGEMIRPAFGHPGVRPLRPSAVPVAPPSARPGPRAGLVVATAPSGCAGSGTYSSTVSLRPASMSPPADPRGSRLAPACRPTRARGPAPTDRSPRRRRRPRFGSDRR